jgi:hypothetical protein
MLVDGQIKRICITKVDGVKQVQEIPKDYTPPVVEYKHDDPVWVYKTQVVIVGAGPAGLAVREELNKHGVENIVIDNNDRLAGSLPCKPTSFSFLRKRKNLAACVGSTLPKPLPVRP